MPGPQYSPDWLSIPKNNSRGHDEVFPAKKPAGHRLRSDKRCDNLGLAGKFRAAWAYYAKPDQCPSPTAVSARLISPTGVANAISDRRLTTVMTFNAYLATRRTMVRVVAVRLGPRMTVIIWICAGLARSGHK